MRGTVKCFAALLALFCIGLSACSKDKGGEPEKGAIKERTDRAAEVMVDRIKTPIESARSVDEMARDRIKGMDEAAKD
ncbi:MAG: hypothetical protein SWQ30_17665 [Thermodesulfobacteriota bacterium]|nr:hypothetical protein [Thermodesulfobacteriota bacterium]